LTVSFEGVVGKQERFWRPTFNVIHGRSEEEWLEGLDAVLRQSVQAHLVSDVPFGAFLSGGLDSAAIVAYMSNILDRPVKAFTIGFGGTDFDETPWAVQAARKFGVEHHIEVLRPNALEILPDLVRHYGEPFGDSSAIPTYYVSKLAARHVPMVLSGDGGDELLAGYQSYQGWIRWSLVMVDRHGGVFFTPSPCVFAPTDTSHEAWVPMHGSDSFRPHLLRIVPGFGRKIQAFFKEGSQKRLKK